MSSDILARFSARVQAAPSGCLEWQGALDRDGYGTLAVNRRPYRAHRFAYEHNVGPIPAGLVIDHLCRNRRCVNPAHLEPVTPGENCRRGDTVLARNLAKTQCAHGHPFSGGNLYVDTRGFRGCRACRREAVSRSHYKLKGVL